MVGTTNRSMAAMSGAWLCKKVRHPWLGGTRRLTIYLATLDCATSNPSLSSSPWMRGAPQSGFPHPTRWPRAGGDLAHPKGIHQCADRALMRSEHPPDGLLHPADLPYLQTHRSNPLSVTPTIELGARIKSS